MTDVINMYQYEEELIDDGINLIAPPTVKNS